MNYDQEKLEAASVCFAAASRLLYCEPDGEELAEQIRLRMFAEAPFGGENQTVRRGFAAMDAWCVEAEAAEAEAFDDQVAALKREWFRLFVGAGTPEAPCWESFYLEPNSQMFGKRTLEVRAWYQRYGLQIERLRSEPDDHLGLMLGFLGHLIELEAEALDDADAEKGAQLACDQEAFLVEHVLPWLPAWHYQASSHAASDYFCGAADLVFGLCSVYAERFGIRYDADSTSFKKERASAAANGSAAANENAAC